ncbi:hypothetical protein Asulf_01354 [Archaeoglobus sulfaticallidus PM70-1]|uniref:Adenine DNA glycosylase n=1 Tax=Archaeoglobus sulfaticallidus PM70-1 TaxID=387631 RepID=N0BM50_9EURY|nr:hypothetical protein [Archaeoglobus sulfaticallidus]AGK61345.1 hypothetical protein Asulf_01354 [Archaeoglobus sulfaticallidus PM70-1]
MKIADEVAEAFRKALLSWGERNIVNYPWRKNRTPYRVLLAEILLHRTRAEQVIPLYNNLVALCPDAFSLAAIDRGELHRMLKSAGLRWRIDLMHEMAKTIVERYNGEIPEKREELMKLPGVSEYIASAVRCFAYGYPEPLLDTNTVRIAGRVFDIEVKDSSRRSKKMREFMRNLLDTERPDVFNYAMIDFGKKVCKKRNPECFACPLWMCSYRIRIINDFYKKEGVFYEGGFDRGADQRNSGAQKWA